MKKNFLSKNFFFFFRSIFQVFDFTTAPTKVVHIAIKCFTIRSRNGFGWFHLIKKSQKFLWFERNQKIFSLQKGQNSKISKIFFWKESIQPQVPLRLPCYDFTSVTHHLVTSSSQFHRKRVKILNFSLKLKRKKLRRQSISMVWRAVCTRLRYIFTAACWSAITSDSIFMVSSCRHQSELRRFFRICSNLHSCSPLSSSL